MSERNTDSILSDDPKFTAFDWEELDGRLCTIYVQNEDGKLIVGAVPAGKSTMYIIYVGPKP